MPCPRNVSANQMDDLANVNAVFPTSDDSKLVTQEDGKVLNFFLKEKSVEWCIMSSSSCLFNQLELLELAEIDHEKQTEVRANTAANRQDEERSPQVLGTNFYIFRFVVGSPFSFT